jgi:hypothetical protein
MGLVQTKSMASAGNRAIMSQQSPLKIWFPKGAAIPLRSMLPKPEHFPVWGESTNGVFWVSPWPWLNELSVLQVFPDSILNPASLDAPSPVRVVNSQGQVVGNQVASIPRLAVRRNIPAEQQPIKRYPIFQSN